MNFFKDPKYKSIRVVLLLVIIIGAGWFVVGNMNQSDSNQGLVANRAVTSPTKPINTTPAGEVVYYSDGSCVYRTIINGIETSWGGTTVYDQGGVQLGCMCTIDGEKVVKSKTSSTPVTVSATGEIKNKSTGQVIGTTVKPKTTTTNTR